MILGLTGGIGSGKSAATGIFTEQSITVVDADIVAREVVAVGRPELEEIKAYFGLDITLADGSLNRPKLREIIFSNPNHKTWLEALLHPAIRNEIATQLADATSPYRVLSSPLLFETNQAEFCDKVAVVDVDIETQLRRTMARDENSQTQVEAIMAAQWPRDKRREQADYIIDNTGNLSQLKAQVIALHQQILEDLNVADKD